MTNSTSSKTPILTTDTNTGAEDKSTMQSLNELFGFHYFATRAVFDIDGVEVVYMNDNIWGRISVYADGEQIYKGWNFMSCAYSDVSATHNGHEYRVISSIRNWISCAQKITVIKDDSKAQSKIDPVLAGIKGTAMFHAVAGSLSFGALLGFIVGYIGN